MKRLDLRELQSRNESGLTSRRTLEANVAFLLLLPFAFSFKALERDPIPVVVFIVKRPPSARTLVDYEAFGRGGDDVRGCVDLDALLLGGRVG